MMMVNCFWGIVNQRKAFSLISSRDHYQRSSPSRISDKLRAGFEPAQKLSSDFVEWSCAEVITTSPQHQFRITNIFSVSLKFEASYITGQWGEFWVKNSTLYLHVLFLTFCFSSKNLRNYFHVCFRQSIKFPQKPELVIKNCPWNCTQRLRV